MYYLSKGRAVKGSTETILKVIRGKNIFRLHGIEAGLWLDGRYGIRTANDTVGITAIRHLERMGIVSSSERGDAVGQYEMLAGGIFCPVAVRGIRRPLRERGKRVYTWLRSAGLHLSMEELVYLEDRGIRPVPELLGEDNRQALTELIYDSRTIQNGVLEREMAASPVRDAVVSSILHLIKTKKVIIL